MESLLNTDVLIRLYNCYNFIYGTVIRGKSNKRSVSESTLGWIMSGPFSMDNETNVYNVDSLFLIMQPSLFHSNVLEKKTV